jgi:hypothetical protein
MRINLFGELIQIEARFGLLFARCFSFPGGRSRFLRSKNHRRAGR